MSSAIRPITDMDASGNVPDDPTTYIETDDAGEEIIPADLPGIRIAFTDQTDTQLAELITRDELARKRLTAHVGHTHADLHDQVELQVDWARRRAAVLDREFAAALNRAGGSVHPLAERAMVDLMTQPRWAKAQHAAVDAMPKVETDYRTGTPRLLADPHRVSPFDREELRAEIADLAAAVRAREAELELRDSRREVLLAEQRQRDLEQQLHQTHRED